MSAGSKAKSIPFTKRLAGEGSPFTDPYELALAFVARGNPERLVGSMSGIASNGYWIDMNIGSPHCKRQLHGDVVFITRMEGQECCYQYRLLDLIAALRGDGTQLRMEIAG